MKMRVCVVLVVLGMLALACSALAEPVTITGTVVDADGNPVEGAKVWPMQAACTKSPTVPIVTNEEGGFVINLRHVTPVYSVSKRAYVPPDFAVYAQGPDGQRAAVQVAPPDVTEVTVTLGDAGFLEARVEDPEGNPVAGADAVLLPKPEGARMSYGAPVLFASDEAGLLRIGPMPAGMDFVVMKGWEVETALLHAWPDQEMTPLAPGEIRELPTMHVNMAGRSIEGVVLNADGDAVAGVTVLTHDTIDRRLAQVRTDDNGRFELPGLMNTGVVGVVAITDDAAAACGAVSDPDVGLDATLQLEPLAVLTGLVTDAEGRPCAGVRVIISTHEMSIDSCQVGDAPKDLRTHVAEALRGKAETDADGRWRIEGLIPGFEYWVSARSPDGRARSVKAVLTGLDINEVTIVLE